MQPFDFVSPPGDGHFPPFAQQSWMMGFGLGEFAHFVGEGERLDKILEFETAFQAFDALTLDDLPRGYLRVKFGNLGLGNRWCTPAAGGTAHARQCFHRSISLAGRSTVSPYAVVYIMIPQIGEAFPISLFDPIPPWINGRDVGILNACGPQSVLENRQDERISSKALEATETVTT
jgi:hypothetical protein